MRWKLLKTRRINSLQEFIYNEHSTLKQLKEATSKSLLKNFLDYLHHFLKPLITWVTLLIKFIEIVKIVTKGNPLIMPSQVMTIWHHNKTTLYHNWQVRKLWNLINVIKSLMIQYLNTWDEKSLILLIKQK